VIPINYKQQMQHLEQRIIQIELQQNHMHQECDKLKKELAFLKQKMQMEMNAGTYGSAVDIQPVTKMKTIPLKVQGDAAQKVQKSIAEERLQMSQSGAAERQSQVPKNDAPKAQSQMPQSNVSGMQPQMSQNSAARMQTQMSQNSAARMQTQIKDDGAVNPENILGKRVMGILASLLVFIGLVSLALLVYDKIPEVLKFGLMVLISGGSLTAGLLIYKRHPSAFSVSLTGCGVGGLYITVIASNLIFHYTGAVVMYLLLLIWVGSVLFLSLRLEQTAFLIVCSCGILLSVFMGAINALPYELLLLTIYTVIAFVGVLLFARKKTAGWIGHLMAILAFLGLSLGFAGVKWSWEYDVLKCLAAGTAMIGLLAVSLSQMVRLDREQENVVSVVLLWVETFLVGVIVFFYMSQFATYTEADSIFTLVFMLFQACQIGCAVFLRLQKGYFHGVVIVSGAYMLIASAVLFSCLNIPISGMFLIYIPVLMYGYKSKQALYVFLGYGAMLLGMMVQAGGYDQSSFAVIYNLEGQVAAVVCILSFYYLYTTAGIWQGAAKCCAYFLCNVAIMSFVDEWIYIQLLLLLLLVLAIESGLYYDWSQELFHFFKRNQRGVKKERVTVVCLAIMEGFLLLSGMVTISYGDVNRWQQIILAVLLGYVSVQKVPDLLDNPRLRSWVGYLCGMRFTMIVLVIVKSFADTSLYPYIDSIILMITAVICIAIGFWKNHSSIRMYGLILTLISVFKLVMADLYMFNSVIRVAAFILGGILCFGISLLYQRAARKNSRKSGQQGGSEKEIDKDLSNNVS